VLVNEILIPSVVKWNRLEGRPRTQDFSQALRSEVADPLWMLTRQWQTGEFEADDAGSPVIAQLTYVTDPLTHLRIADGTTVELDDDLPLEAMVERHPIPRTVGGQPVSLDLRLVAGRHWVKMLDAVGLPSTIVADFRTAYPVADSPARRNATRPASGVQAGASRRRPRWAPRAVSGSSSTNSSNPGVEP
jgi:hypothetical protein